MWRKQQALLLKASSVVTPRIPKVAFGFWTAMFTPSAPTSNGNMTTDASKAPANYLANANIRTSKSVYWLNTSRHL